MKLFSIALVSACAALLVGCAGQVGHELSIAEASTPSGSAFDKALRLETLTIAKRELEEADRANSLHDSEKASMPAVGKTVAPDDFTSQHVFPEYRDELANARSRRLTALGGPSAKAQPALGAKALLFV